MSSPTYDEAYFREYHVEGGHMRYERSPHWLRFFRGLADEIVRRLEPTTSLDAGCAIGLLVEALRDSGVDAEGIDVSEYAISEAPESIRDHVRVASLTEPIGGRYDLVTCIEVIEHIPPEDTHLALRHLTEVTDTLLLSSTPADFDEPTHVNVRPPEFWAARLAELGFHRDPDFDARFISPWAALYRRTPLTVGEIVARHERERWQLATERDVLRREVLARSADEPGASASGLTGEVQRLRDELRAAIDFAHGADARRATAEATLRHTEYANQILEAREKETGRLVERLYEMSGGDANRLAAMLDARTFQVYWKLIKPYRWLRDRR